MRKFVCTLLMVLMAVSGLALSESGAQPDPASVEPAATAASETAQPTPVPQEVRVAFEDGFALRLPEGWKFYPTNAQMAERGVLYCLSDATGSGWLYVQRWGTDCADMDELQALIGRATQSFSSGIHSFNGCDFVVYDLSEGDVSCCATLLDSALLNLVFTPQSDAGFMAVAARILNSFERI